MNAATILLRDYVSPAVTPRGFELRGNVLRRWSDDREVCTAVAVMPYSRTPLRVTCEVGYLSPFVARQFGMPECEFPSPRNCSGPGIYLRLEDLVGRRDPEGWAAESTEDIRRTGGVFRDCVPACLDRHQALQTLDGWASYFRDLLDQRTEGRGYCWSMLGYALLGQSDVSDEEVEAVLEAHEREHGTRKNQNQLSAHLARQRELLRERRATRNG